MSSEPRSGTTADAPGADELIPGQSDRDPVDVPMPGPVLTVRDLGKRYRTYPSSRDRLVHWLSGGCLGRATESWALQGVDLEVQPGEVLGVIGRNGAGKSSLLGMLTGTLRPTTGEVVRHGSLRALLQLGAGIDPELDAIGNIRRILALHHGGRPPGQAQVDEVLAFAELADDGKPFRAYSAGMQLRLGFAIATAERPDVLLIDEVLAVGDYFFRRKCYDRITAMRAAGTALVIVSHALEEIAHWSSRVLVLRQGQPVFLGEPKEAVKVFQQDRPRTERRPVLPNAGDVRSGALELLEAWPAQGQAIDLRGRGLKPGSPLRLSGIWLLDHLDAPCRAFTQGAEIRLLVELEAIGPVQHPYVTMLLLDKRGVVVHGLNSLMRPHVLSPTGGAGTRYRFSFTFRGTLALGEYGLDVAVGEVDGVAAGQLKGLAWEQVAEQFHPWGRIEGLATIALLPDPQRQPTAITHIGVTDLPGTLAVACFGPASVAIPEPRP